MSRHEKLGHAMESCALRATTTPGKMNTFLNQWSTLMIRRYGRTRPLIDLGVVTSEPLGAGGLVSGVSVGDIGAQCSDHPPCP